MASFAKGAPLATPLNFSLGEITRLLLNAICLGASLVFIALRGPTVPMVVLLVILAVCLVARTGIALAERKSPPLDAGR